MKRISIITIASLMFMLIVATNALAFSPSGLIDGVTGSVSSNMGGGTTTLVTDNNLTNGFVYQNGVTNKYIQFNLPNNTTLTSLKLKLSGLTGTMADQQFSIQAYNNDGGINTFLGYFGGSPGNFYTGVYDGTEVNPTDIANVDFVWVIASTSNGFTMHEIELYGTYSDAIPPSTPTGLAGVPSDSQVELSWNANSETDLNGYNIYVDNVKHNGAIITGTTYTVTGLTNLTEYDFQVSAVDDSLNESTKSTAIQETPEAIPIPLNINLVASDTEIVVQVTGGQAPYTVTWLAESEVFSTASYTITGLTPETNYSVTVTDANSETVTKSKTTTAVPIFVAPVIPNPDSVFQLMLDNFGTAGTTGLAIIGGAVALGVVIIIALYAWRLAKRWLATTK